jgi:hypothetical protein
MYIVLRQEPQKSKKAAAEESREQKKLVSAPVSTQYSQQTKKHKNTKIKYHNKYSKCTCSCNYKSIQLITGAINNY